MIINPVMMRSALKARGVHAAMVSFMKAPSSPRRRLNWYRVAALRESFGWQRNLASFAEQQGIMPLDECMRRCRRRNTKFNPTKRAGRFPRPFVAENVKSFLAPLDLGDLVGLGAAGRHDFDRGALLLADQRARQGRGDRNAALLGVGFRLADDLPHRFLVGVFVDQRHGRAELDGVAGEL